MVYDRRIVTIKHYYEVEVVLSKIRKDKSPSVPPSGDIAVTSFQQKNLNISEMVYDRRIVTIKHYYKVEVVLKRPV